MAPFHRRDRQGAVAFAPALLKHLRWSRTYRHDRLPRILHPVHESEHRGILCGPFLVFRAVRGSHSGGRLLRPLIDVFPGRDRGSPLIRY